MNAVLYTHQMEPITVVDIPMFLWDQLKNGDVIVLPVIEPPKFKPDISGQVDFLAPKRVTIFGELLRRYGHEALMLFTNDEENAMLLRAEFLPGQRNELRSRERSAFAAGFIKALQEFRA